jgi:hypothetical protein
VLRRQVHDGAGELHDLAVLGRFLQE